MIPDEILFDQERWKKADSYTSTTRSLTDKGGKEDLTVDGYIHKYGAIESHADSKMHTSKSSYMDSLKANDLTIKDS